MEKPILAPGIPENKTRQCKTCGNAFDTTSSASRYSFLCPECRAKDDAKKEKDRLENIKDLREEAVYSWCPPGRFYLQTSIANFKPRKGQELAYAKTKQFIAKPEKGLYLYGGPGLGKTHLAAAIYNHFWETWDRLKRQSPQARFLRENDLFKRLRNSFHDGASESEGEILDDYIESGAFLILDDLCKYQPADRTFRNRIYYELFDRIWSGDETPIIVLTANIGPSELVSELGLPTADRIRDMCQLCEMKGDSYRGKRELMTK